MGDFMIKLFTLFGLTSTALIFNSFAMAAETAVASPGTAATVAEVDGVKLTLAELEQKQGASLFQARNTYYDTQRKAVNDLIDQYLLERQAKKEGVTVTELLEKHVNKNIAKDPSEDAVRVYYEGSDANEPFEVAKDKIIQYIRGRRTAKLQAAYMQSLKSQAKIVIELAAPRAQLSLKDTAVRGNSQAPVTVVEYADYECPYCQIIAPTVEKLRAEFKDKVAFAYKHMPLNIHPHAQKAAEASNCAGDQGKFWEFHDKLTTGKQFEVPKLKEIARDLKLNGEKFDKCLDSGEQAAIVKAQGAEGQAMGIPGTPAFFVNGRFVTTGVNYEGLKSMIEEELNASGSRLTSAAKR
jgi:protein-disulfide isomerase